MLELLASDCGRLLALLLPPAVLWLAVPLALGEVLALFALLSVPEADGLEEALDDGDVLPVALALSLAEGEVELLPLLLAPMLPMLLEASVQSPRIFTSWPT